MRQLRKVTGKFSNCQNSHENNYFNAIKSNSVFNRDSGYEHGCQTEKLKFACLLTNHLPPLYPICGY